MRRRMRASSAGVTKSGTMTAPWAKMLSVVRGMLSLQVRSGHPLGRSTRTPAGGLEAVCKGGAGADAPAPRWEGGGSDRPRSLSDLPQCDTVTY